MEVAGLQQVRGELRRTRGAEDRDPYLLMTLAQVRGELRRTRGALAATAETAAVRWRRLKRIEGGGDARRR